MPHIVIKTLSGKSQDQLQEAARQAVAVISKTLGKPEKYCSASVEEYSPAEWVEVYNGQIKDSDKVLVKPGYTDPVTFT